MNMMQQRQDDLPWADKMRALATITVILLHVANPIVSQYERIPEETWWFGNIIEGSVRFCVPLFLMLTGVLILPKDYELGTFFRKRMNRILLPFLFWSLVYIAYGLITKWQLGQPVGFRTIVRSVFFSFKNGAAFHLWYIYMLIGIYLTLPVMSKWVQHCSRKELGYFLAIWFTASVLSMPFISKLRPNVDLLYFSGYIGYPILGHYLSDHFDKKRAISFGLILLVTGTIVTIAGTYLLSRHHGILHREFYDYLSPNVIIASAGIFLLLRYGRSSDSGSWAVTRFISRYSYGIYLSHVLFLMLLKHVSLTWSFVNPILGTVVTTLTCLALSAVATYLIGKLPWGDRISGR